MKVRILPALIVAVAAAGVPTLSYASGARKASDMCAPSQGATLHAIVRERRKMRGRPHAIGCVPGPVTVKAARIVWGDGATTPVSVKVEAEAGGATDRMILPVPPRHSYARANCPVARRLLYRCTAGYRMVLVVETTNGRTLESEPVEVSVLAAADRIVVVPVHASGGVQKATVRIVCGGDRRARELTVRVAWGANHVETVRLHGSGRVFRFTAGHRERGRGPRFVKVTVRDRLGRSTASAGRALR